MTFERLIEREISTLVVRQTFSACPCRQSYEGRAGLHSSSSTSAHSLLTLKSPNLLQPLFSHLVSRDDNSICHNKEVMKIMFDSGCKCSSFISLHFLLQSFPFPEYQPASGSPTPSNKPFFTPYLCSCTPFSSSNALFPFKCSFPRGSQLLPSTVQH